MDPLERVRSNALNRIGDIKDLEKFLKLCRKQGVSEVSYEGLRVKFGDLPSPRPRNREDEDVEPESDGLTDDQLMFYHHAGNPL